MAIRMQQRRGTSEQWTTANPILAPGEIGWESETNKFKIGDGVNAWADLSYFIDEDTLGGSIDDYVPLTAVGEPDGVASLDANGDVPLSQLGNVPSTDLTGYATETYVDTVVANVIDSAPGALDTLNELAAALGDDENFATTVTNSIAAKADAAHTHTTADISNVSAAMRTFLTTPTSGNLASAITGETGSGDLVFSTSASLTSPGIVWPNLTLNPTVSTLLGRLTRDGETLKLGMGNNQTVTFTNDEDLVIAQSQVTNLTTDLSAKAPLESPTFTGNVNLPATTTIDGITSTELSYLNGVTSPIQTQLGDKADLVHTHVLADITDYVEPSGTTMSDTAPSSPAVGDRWVKTTTWQEYIYFDGYWVEI